jgi:hypothetical protein
MGIGATNRIINPRAIIGQQLKEYRQLKAYKKRRKEQWKTNNLRTITSCSKCHRGMRKDTADEQIKNKRENAPICIPCIMGRPRKTLVVKHNLKK